MSNIRFCVFYLLAFFFSGPSVCEKKNEVVLPETFGNKFLYFAFGSNLLLKRIRIQNKSAVRKSMGKLMNYELDFYTNSTRWKGAPATIVAKSGKFVWGAIWEIDVERMHELDRQESVHEDVYVPISVNVEIPSGDVLACRAYQLKSAPPVLTAEDTRPIDRQPSATYLKAIIKGAKETNLPDSYINFLRSFKHNEVTVDDIEKDLDLNGTSIEIF